MKNSHDSKCAQCFHRFGGEGCTTCDDNYSNMWDYNHPKQEPNLIKTLYCNCDLCKPRTRLVSVTLTIATDLTLEEVMDNLGDYIDSSSELDDIVVTGALLNEGGVDR